MKVAGLQLDIAWEDPGESFRRAAELASEAAAAGARLLVLPEMFATGFSMRSEAVVAHAPAVREFLAGMATGHGVWVAGGYAEPGRKRPRNACVVVSPAGVEVARYHKIHPFTLAGEPDHYEAGDSTVTVEVEGVRVTPFVCYDLRFPELFRATAEATDLFLVIANWPDVRGHAWRVLLRARAIDGMAFALGVNRVGVAEGKVHRGDSALVDPIGQVVASRALRPGVVLGEVDPDEVERARKRLSFLADRRPDVYRRLDPEGGSS